MTPQTVKVVRRIVNRDQPINVGVERDNKVRTIIFTGVPELGDALTHRLPPEVTATCKVVE